tara:strand:+ start:1224 stop:1685 length:462 start_codon:yes stop_codon:yes gene_type:complete
MIEEISDLFGRLQDRLIEAFNLSSDEALGLALMMIQQKKKSLSSEGLTAKWRKRDALSLAGHFYWLSKTYQRSQETGRAITFKRASNVIYDAINADQGFTGEEFFTHPHIGAKVRLEAYQIWLNQGYTPRVEGLIQKGKVDPLYPAPMTEWVG